MCTFQFADHGTLPEFRLISISVWNKYLVVYLLTYLLTYLSLGKLSVLPCGQTN